MQALDGKAQDWPTARNPAGLGPMNRDLTRLPIAVDGSDTPPANEIVETFTGMCQEANAALARWGEAPNKDLAELSFCAGATVVGAAGCL